MPSLPPVHRPSGTNHARERREQNRQADQRRGSARQRGYTTEWDRYALAYLEHHPLCVGCQAMGWVEPATCVDHIEPASRAPDRFWDSENHQAGCSWHHDRVKQRMELMLASGKASVAEMRLTSDLAKRLTLGLLPGRS